ncbi:hypothetical protein [Stenotrophomonas sp. 2694]|jgi:hypothetical protein|uniref:hypothetical protein n=1 Tax=Stenotrophomonas sp. 2694 TaxID=3156317 RepID=UPI0003EA72D2|nr:hypothetical protein X548_12890 [Stenotrophomonas maltophilia 5BA-I-2]
MSSWPEYAEIRFADYGEEIVASEERTDMERGPSKMRALNSRVMKNVYASVQFRSAADAEAFEEWYLRDVGRVGWFTMEHPRTRQPISARFPQGIGRLVPLNTQFRFSKRDLVLEYMR